MKALIELVKFDVTDVITTSTPNNTSGSTDEEDLVG